MSVEFLKAALEDGDPDEFGEVLYDSGWENDGKYQNNEVILHISEDKAAEFANEDIPAVPGYYLIQFCRSGSYFSDYDYLDTEVYEVEIYYETKPVLRWKLRTRRV